MTEVPPLRQRLKPLLLFGYTVAAIRLGLDFWDPESAMVFGLFYLMPVAIIYIGITRRWGMIGWKAMALTMVAVGFLVWGICNSLTYTLGQFMEWTDGRYYPGERSLNEAGEAVYRDGRAAPVAASALGKIGAGLLHGLLSSLVSSVWCIAFGTLFVWVYRRPEVTATAPD